MKNRIIQNVFSKEELEDINLANSKRLDTIEVQDQLGRTRLDYAKYDLHLMPGSILKKADEIAKNFLNHDGKEFKFWYYSFVEYNDKYGIPKLGAHRDTAPFSASILCQVESNTSWDVYVDGIPYTLDDNSALTINVRDQDHWRNDKEFKEGDFIKMAFLHYLNEEDTFQNVATPEQMLGINRKWAHITGWKEEDMGQIDEDSMLFRKAVYPGE